MVILQLCVSLRLVLLNIISVFPFNSQVKLQYNCVYADDQQPYPLMSFQEKGRPLPKFGEWDVNNPASADGFTLIFAKARDDKKPTPNGPSKDKPSSYSHPPQHPPPPKKWFCCF